MKREKPPKRAPVRGDTGKTIKGVVNPEALPEAWEIDCARDGAATARTRVYLRGELISHCVAINPGSAMMVIVRDTADKIITRNGWIVTEVITGPVEVREHA